MVDQQEEIAGTSPDGRTQSTEPYIRAKQVDLQAEDTHAGASPRSSYMWHTIAGAHEHYVFCGIRPSHTCHQPVSQSGLTASVVIGMAPWQDQWHVLQTHGWELLLQTAATLSSCSLHRYHPNPMGENAKQAAAVKQARRCGNSEVVINGGDHPAGCLRKQLLLVRVHMRRALMDSKHLHHGSASLQKLQIPPEANTQQMQAQQLLM